MRDLRLVIGIAWFAALWLYPPHGLAQESGSTSSSSLAANEIYLWNSTAATVNFQVEGSNCDSAINDSLGPNYNNTYSCDGAEYFNVTIVTQKPDNSLVTRKYGLDPGLRYQIYQSSDGVYEIAKM